MSVPPLAVKLVLYAASLLVLGFFAGMETALTSLSTISLAKLKSRFPRRQKYLAFWETQPNEALATILVGTNLMLVATGVLAASLALDLAAASHAPTASVIALVSAASIVITLVAGDIVPKIISRYHSEPVAIAGLPFLVLVANSLRSFNRLLLALSERIIGLLGRKATGEKPFLQPDELKVLLLSDETLPLSKPARRMMRNILDFGTTRISQVMVPREKIHAVNLDQPTEKIIEQIIDKEYSRVPVYRGNLDNIVGIVYSKDLTIAWRGGSLFVVEDLIRPAYFVPGSARIDQVLREFRTGHQHLALVVDEFGSTVGLATIEDLVEEIVGEIWDEYDIQEKAVIPMPDGSYLVRAGESLGRVNEELGLTLPAAEFTTVSGWALDLFGRIPKTGEKTRWGDVEIEIDDADKRKIVRVRIRKPGQQRQ